MPWHIAQHAGENRAADCRSCMVSQTNSLADSSLQIFIRYGASPTGGLLQGATFGPNCTCGK